jgi:hypothetical protein
MSLMLWYSWGKPREKGAVMSGSEKSAWQFVLNVVMGFFLFCYGVGVALNVEMVGLQILATTVFWALFAFGVAFSYRFVFLKGGSK